MRAQIKPKRLDSFTPVQRVVCDVVREHDPVGPSEAHEQYAEDIDDRRAIRRVARERSVRYRSDDTACA
jgi:hypothetical protein